MSRSNKSALGDSWVDGADDGDVSLDDEEDYSSSGNNDEMVNERKGFDLNRSPKSLKNQRSPKNGLKSPEPEFIMPSPMTSGSYYGDYNTSKRNAAKRHSTPSKRHTMQELSSIHKRKQRQTPKIDKSSTTYDQIMENILLPATLWCIDVIGNALKVLKKPISLALAVYLFLGALKIAQNLLTTSVYNAMSPICRIPGTSMLDLPFCHPPMVSTSPSLPSKPHAINPEFNALMKVQEKFEDVLSDTTAGLALPWEMKRSEISMRDLRTIIRYTEIRSKNELMHEFDTCIEASQSTVYKLQEFNSHVGRGVDMVLSTARWTQTVLDEINQQQQGRNMISAFINDKLLGVFQPMQFTESKLLDQYIKHTYAVSNEIERLIHEADDLRDMLKNMENRFELITEIAIRDKIHVQGAKDEVMGNLFSYLGANRKELKKHNSNLQIYNQIIINNDLANKHVDNVRMKLQDMQTELTQLRERIAEPGKVQEAGVGSVSLSVHLQAIRLGVERLEQKREETRGIERSQREKPFHDQNRQIPMAGSAVVGKASIVPKRSS